MSTRTITHLEATCPNCGQELEVEIPEEFIYRPNNVNEARLIHLTSKRATNTATINELVYLSSRLKGWRSKKALRLVRERVKELQTLNNLTEPEIYTLYNKINPPIGEHSNS